MNEKTKQILYLLTAIVYLLILVSPLYGESIFTRSGGISPLVVFMYIFILTIAGVTIRYLYKLFKVERRISKKMVVRLLLFFLLIPVVYVVTFVLSIFLQEAVIQLVE